MNQINFLKQMILSGVNNLHNNYPHIDKLNVFPVPDGDTGTNMNLTATNGYLEIKDKNFDSIGSLLQTFSKGLIMGARGNSGVIFSQIIKGFYIGLKDAQDLTVVEWKKAFDNARITSYKAVMQPVEGTILTVIRETSEEVQKLDDVMPIKEFWTNVINFANTSLENTPNLLQALKDVGVVDSGGYGLVKFLEGMDTFVQTGKIVTHSAKLEANSGGNIDIVVDQEFGYCTEGIVILEDQWIGKLESRTIRDQLQMYGNNSIVVVIDEEILKVHTHALAPGQVLTFLQQYGDFRTIKVENMTLQSNRQVKGGNLAAKESPWKETSSIKMVRKLENNVATIAVVSSQEQKKYFEQELGINYAIDGGGKMNPSTNDFLKAIELVDAKVVFIFPNNGNVLLTARQAEKIETKSKIIVIPTKSIQQGMVSVLNFDPNATTSANTKNLTKAIKSVVSFSVSVAAKNSFVDGIEVKKNSIMGVVDGKIVGTEPSVKLVFERILAKYITNKVEILTIFVGQDADAKNVSDLRKVLDENYDVEYEIIEGGQKVYSFLIAIE